MTGWSGRSVNGPPVVRLREATQEELETGVALLEEDERLVMPSPAKSPATPKAPRLGSYTDATGSTTVACGCRLDTLPRCVVVTPCDGHRAVMVVEMRHREPGS